jgi:hypothetical protein
VRTDSVPPIPAKPTVRGSGSDQFSAANSAALRAALAAQPEIRPDVVVRGKALAADPSYPSPEILRSVGQAILRSPDLSVDLS